MKVIFLFFIVAAAIFGVWISLKKQDRQAVKSAVWRYLPAVIAAAAITTSLLFLALNSSMKVI